MLLCSQKNESVLIWSVVSNFTNSLTGQGVVVGQNYETMTIGHHL